MRKDIFAVIITHDYPEEAVGLVGRALWSRTAPGPLDNELQTMVWAAKELAAQYGEAYLDQCAISFADVRYLPGAVDAELQVDEDVPSSVIA